MSEKKVLKAHKKCLKSSLNVEMWRNNVGLFKSLDGKRRIYCGLCVGSADLIGYESVLVTPAMVGSRVAIFRADETKSALKNGKLSDSQIDWLQSCKRDGAIVNVVTEDGLTPFLGSESQSQ